VVVLGVVPGEELPQECTCVLERGEALGEGGAVLEGLELCLGEGVVVGAWGREWLLATSSVMSSEATG
jgi:hypothetical protein